MEVYDRLYPYGIEVVLAEQDYVHVDLTERPKVDEIRAWLDENFDYFSYVGYPETRGFTRKFVFLAIESRMVLLFKLRFGGETFDSPR